MERILSIEELKRERRIANACDVEIVNAVDGSMRRWCTATDGELEWCVFRQIMTHQELHKELANLVHLRKVPHIHNALTIHPTVDVIRIRGFHYVPLYRRSPYVQPLEILTQRHMHVMVHTFRQLHYNNIMMAYQTIPTEWLCLTDHDVPLIHWTRSLKSFKEFTEEASHIVQQMQVVPPLFVILEMLSSNLEPDVIDYKQFKMRFDAFFNHICNRFCQQPYHLIAKEYFVAVSGAVDYTDYLLNRYCILTADNHIKKDKSKAMGYWTDIDLFVLAMTLNERFPQQAKLPPYRAYIGECVRGSYPDVLKDWPDEDIFSEQCLKPFDIVNVVEGAAAVEGGEQAVSTPQAVVAGASDASIASSVKSDGGCDNKPLWKVIFRDSSIDVAAQYKVDASGQKKLILPGGTERVIRSDGSGDYVLWKGNKLHFEIR